METPVSLILKKIINTPLKQIPHKILPAFKHYLLDYPSGITVQTVVACNLKCKHCFLNDFGETIPDGFRGMMDFEDFKNIVNRLKKFIKRTNEFYFSTFEPLLHKDIFKMMDYVLEINPKLQFPIVTNAKIIDDQKLKQLLKYPIPSYTISLDGIQKDTVENFKIGLSFEKTIETIKKIIEFDKNASVGTVFVLHKNNVNELIDYPDFVNSLGVKKILINNLMSFSSKFTNQYLYTKNGNKQVEEIFQYIIKRAKANGQQIWLPLMKPVQMGCRQCESLFIDINGNVTPCDMLSVSTQFEFFGNIKRNRPIIFGNVYQQDPLKIYRLKAFKQFRAKHRKGKNLPQSCQFCIDAYGLLCSHRKAYGAPTA